MAEQTTSSAADTPSAAMDTSASTAPAEQPTTDSQPSPPPTTTTVAKASPAPSSSYPIKLESSTTLDTTTTTNSAPAGGAPVRQYLNEFVTPYLLEGMKRLARERPSNPLEVLGNFLMEKSAQVEGQGRDTRMGDVD